MKYTPTIHVYTMNDYFFVNILAEQSCTVIVPFFISHNLNKRIKEKKKIRHSNNDKQIDL